MISPTVCNGGSWHYYDYEIRMVTIPNGSYRTIRVRVLNEPFEKLK